MKIRPPKFIKKLFPTFIWNFPDEKEGIFLTFDDGPNSGTTDVILNILKFLKIVPLYITSN